MSDINLSKTIKSEWLYVISNPVFQLNLGKVGPSESVEQSITVINKGFRRKKVMGFYLDSIPEISQGGLKPLPFGKEAILEWATLYTTDIMTSPGKPGIEIRQLDHSLQEKTWSHFTEGAGSDLARLIDFTGTEEGIVDPDESFTVLLRVNIPSDAAMEIIRVNEFSFSLNISSFDLPELISVDFNIGEC